MCDFTRSQTLAEMWTDTGGGAASLDLSSPVSSASAGAEGTGFAVFAIKRQSGAAILVLRENSDNGNIRNETKLRNEGLFPRLSSIFVYSVVSLHSHYRVFSFEPRIAEGGWRLPRRASNSVLRIKISQYDNGIAIA
jgi:hypothetical protein